MFRVRLSPSLVVSVIALVVADLQNLEERR